ncbi:unhealthy ribosome biogenesis protein 2 homolog isoform 2-T4 [Porphyrio hochstetteri]
MAAIYSGIYLKLKSAKTSWEDKLKLAHFAWISHQCVLPNKEQVLLDWVSHALVSYYNKKPELEDEVVEKLWAYLDNIIHSKRLQNLLKSGKTIGLSFSIAQVINERLSEACSQKTQQNIGTVLSCSSGILSTPSLSIIYTAKCELLVDLLSKLSKLACQQLASDDTVCSQVFSVLQLTFAQYLLIQRQQTNPNRVFGQVTSHLLQPCLLLRHLLTVRSWTQTDDNHVRQHLSREIRNQVETLLQAGLFQPELFSSYKEELLPEQEKKKGTLKSLLLPVKTIQTKLGSDFCEPALHGAVVAGSVSLLYKLFLDSYCKAENHLVCFHMLSRLFGCLRLSGLQQGVGGDTLSPAGWSGELLALEQLLNSVLSSDLYNVASDRIRHKEVQFGFYRKLAQTLMSHSQASIPAWFRCLKLLMSLNHLIVEPDLDDLVSSAWIDAKVSEPRTKKPQEALINTMFQTYSKLRQFPRLFEEVLTVICWPAADELRQPVFSGGLTVKLRECLLELPPNQILDILCCFVEKCQTLIIPAVKGSADMALKLLSVSSVLHAFLFNMRSLDDVTPSSVVLRTQNLLANMQKGIIQPLMELLQAPRREEEKSDLWLRKASDSAFLLVYTWVEVDTLFDVSCSKYVSPAAEIAGAVTASAARHRGVSAFLPGVGERCWEGVTGLANSFASTSKYCLEQLMLQKMKMTLMQTEADLQALQHAAAFILESGRYSMSRGESEPWDGDISTISDLTYPTAHWHLVISNLTILLPYISQKDVEYIGNVLLETIVLAKAQEADADLEPSISIGKISLGFMHSSFLPEMKVLHCAFLTSLIHQFAGVLPSAARDSVDLPLQLLSVGNIPWHEEILAPCRPADPLEAPSENKLLKAELSLSWKTLERVAQCMVLLAKNGCPVTLKESQLESCLGLLEIASLLKLDSLLPSDCTRCYLVLLSLLANTRASGSCSKLLLLKFLTTCFHLLRCLQAGRNANCVFKVFHASDVLEAVMISQLTASKFFTSVLTAPVWTQYLQEVQSFLENFLQMIIERRQSVRLNLEKFMSFLVSCKPGVGAAKSKDWKNWNPAAGQILLMAFTTLCQVVTHYLQQLPEKKQQSAEVLSALLEPVVLQMVTTVEHSLQSNTPNQPLPVAFIPSVTMLLKADLSHAVKKGWQKDPAAFLEQPRIKLYQKFYSQIMRELPCAGGNLQFLQPALQFLAAFCSVPELYPGKETAVMVFFAIKKLLTGPAVTTQVIQSIEMELTEVLVQLLGNCSAEEFYAIMRLVLQGLEMRNAWQQKDKEVLSAVTLTKLLLGCPLSGDKEKAFWFASPQIITALAMQTKEACQDQSLISTIVVPILEAVAALLRHGEGVLLNPHHVALAFSILLTVPLDHLKTEDYRGVFLGVHEVLFSIVQCHPKVLLKAAPSFLNSFHRLVVSVMHEGRQKGERGNTDDFEVVLKCAHLVERMYTHIAAEMEDFTVFSAFIVAHYVTELQKVTLHPAVKKHLTEGIYRILDLCIERDIKFLNASLPAGVREVFKDLYNDYNHYHKAKKQGEEKYTA